MVSASLVKELREKTGAGMLDCKNALEATNNMEEAIDWLREKGISKAGKKQDRIAAEGISSILTENNTAVIIEVNAETDFVAKNVEFIDMVSEILKTIINANVVTVEEALSLKYNNETIRDLIVAKTSKIGEKLSFRRFEKITKNESQIFGTYIHMGGKIATVVLVDGTNQEVANNIAMQTAAMRPLFAKREEVPTEVLEKEKAIMKEQLINEGKNEAVIEKILVGKVIKYYEDVCLEDQLYIKAENKETVGKYAQDNNCKIVKMIRFEVGEGMEKRNENFADEVEKQIRGE